MRTVDEETVQLQQGELCMLVQAFPVNTSGKEAILPGNMHQLLTQYSDVFNEPKELPPKRTHDHVIPLKEGA